MFFAALFTIAKTWKQPRCPSTDEYIKKMWCIYTMEYDSAVNGVSLSPLKWMNLKSVTGEGNGNPLQFSRLDNPRDGGAW